MRGKRWRLLATAAVVVILAAGGYVAGAAPVGVAKQPGQPTSGYGSNGPCGQSMVSFPTPHWAKQTTYVYLPIGPAAAPMGGTCNGSKRPVVVIAHGTNESDQSTFKGLVNHLVSKGSIVVYPTHTGEA